MGPLTPTKVLLETVKGLTTKTKFVGTMQLALIDNANVHHMYDILDCIFDPESPINIVEFHS